jgi:drug/metabolite transporter (DMT)-like permease
MTITALVLVLTSSVLHASWNLLAKRAGGGVALVWLYGLVSAALLTPPALALAAFGAAPVEPARLGFTLASALVHVVYFVVLQRGYRHGDLSLVYPIARGTGPVLTTVAAIAWLGERPSGLALAGAALVALSVFTLARPSQAAGAPSRRAVAYGLVIGVLIAVYTLCDKQAVTVDRVPPLIQQWATSLALVSFLAPSAWGHREEVRRQWRGNRPAILGIGILIPTAYILVLAAMRISPVSYVAPAREVSILVATLMGMHVLSEGSSRTRLTAAATMVAGVVALALG